MENKNTDGRHDFPSVFLYYLMKMFELQNTLTKSNKRVDIVNEQSLK